jgi:hypothetical protein
MEKMLLMRRLLDRGVAEIHQHASAGLDFPLLWAGALAALASPTLTGDAMVGPGTPIEGATLLRWLLVAAVGRIVLAEFLLRRELPDGAASLHDFLTRLCRPRGARFQDRWTLQRAFAALVLDPKGEPPPFTSLRSLYARWHPTGARMADHPPTALAQVWRGCDPIAVRLRLGTPFAGERWLVRHGLAYLEACERAGRPDPWFTAAFWQIVRLRCIYYRHIVQRPLTSGLQWFLRFYSHFSPLAAPLSQVRPEAAFRVEVGSVGDSERIAALELRVSGGETAVEIGEQLRTIVRSWGHVLGRFGAGDCPELGVIAHFTKERDSHRSWTDGTPQAYGAGTHAEPQGRFDPGRAAPTCHEVRFGEYLASRAHNARALAELLHAVPSALWLMRGIDVASDELAVPTWALVPLYRYVRQEAAYAAMLPGAQGAPPLRTTAHVGEDFRHLMEGLRRIFEAARYLLAANGGRIGHATALGFEPRAWAGSVGALLMPMEERLWDLIFEWRLYAGFEVPAEFVAHAPAGRQAYLAVHIRELVQEICGCDDGGRTWEASDLAQLHHDLHELMAGETRAVLRPDELSVARGLRRVWADERWASPRRAARIQRYLGDRCVFRRGQQLVDVTLNEAEIAALEAVQQAVRRGIAARGIVVEVNPTSNLLIGDLLDLRNHPILRLFPVEPEEGPPPVQIAIGSDDPITFNTSLLREYALLYQAARAAGYSDRTVQDWLDRVRQTSMDARFSLAWRPDAPTRARRLRDDLDRFLQAPGARLVRRARRRAAIDAGGAACASPA